MTTYRSIYEQHHGPIPKDSDGRTYDIHHIDGNRNNNDPSNLIALSIEEHYNIHLDQGEYSAALFIKQRMQSTKEDLSRLATLANLKRVENGTHPFLTLEHKPEQYIKAVNTRRKNSDVWRVPGTSEKIQETKRINGTDKGWKRSKEASSKAWETRRSNGNATKQLTCPHCGKSGIYHNMKRYHFDNCKTISYRGANLYILPSLVYKVNPEM